jgi:hypothetical protein
MFTIDLLKGQGIPIKSGPERLLFAAATAAGPGIAVIILLGMYLSSAAAISVHRQGIVGYDGKMARPELVEALAGQKRFEQNKSLSRAVCRKCPPSSADMHSGRLFCRRWWNICRTR